MKSYHHFWKSPQLIILFFAVLIVGTPLFGQQFDYNKTVQIEATVDPDLPSITLEWPGDPDAGSFNIYRRVPGSTTWGPIFEALDGSAVSFTDTDVEVGTVYEYRVSRGSAAGIGYGYMYAGIEVPVVDYMGRLLVIIDNNFTDVLAPEIEIMLQDFRADGWEVEAISVSPDDEVADVKAEIVDWYSSAPTQSRAVFLFGHIPVPYSGNIYPDGHTDHIGAWPADVFYGEMDGTWNDISVNNVSASQARNHNIPGDGKYDHSTLPSDLELGVGRVDFNNLPTFVESEEELLRRYILKNHDFKRKAFSPIRRALIENNFGSFEEGFGQNGLKNFTVMFGRDSVSYTDYSTLYSESYLCSYGCGGGSYTSASGIGNTGNFANDSLQTVFTMLFGSYFGDWDSQNNFLRAALGSGTTLTNAWSARPNWEFHPMAIGYPIGDCARLSQNNTGFSYEPGFGNRMVHAALMGDPTLRLHMVTPPTNLTLAEDNGHVILNWEAAAEPVIGYNIYRKRKVESGYELVNTSPLTTLSYTDSCLTFQEDYDYLVKSLKLETTASGSYYNQSLGADGSIQIMIDNSVTAAFEVTGTDGSTLDLQNNSVNANVYFWMFGDGTTSDVENPQHLYDVPGLYEITLTAYGDCDTSTISLSTFVTNTSEVLPFDESQILPNPVHEKLFFDCPECVGEEIISVITADGVVVKALNAQILLNNGMDVSDLSTGVYFLEVASKKGRQSFPFIKQ